MDMSDEPDPKTIKAVLAYDGLADAERLTGASYKDDEATMALGMFLHMGSADMKRSLMRETHDTHHSMDWHYARSVIADLGFTIGHVGVFAGTNGQQEQFILAHSPRGLIFAESYNWPGRSSTNSLRFYFNFRYQDFDDKFWLHASGHVIKDRYDQGERIWTGDHSNLDGLRFWISEAEEHGEFVTPWIERPSWVSLTTYADSSAPGVDELGHDEYVAHKDAINSKRLALLGDAAADFLV